MVKRNTFLLVVISLFFFAETQAQVSTRKLEAIYLYNFTKYINWQKATGSYTIGVLGDSDIAQELETNLKSKGGITVKTINNVAEGKSCEIVYLPKAKSASLADLVKTLSSQGVLIVTEDDLAAQGASVSFVLDGSKLRFKINQQALDNAGLQASSSLLSLAIVL